MDQAAEDREFHNDAFAFIRRMLIDIKELLPYGNLKYIAHANGFYPVPLPQSFYVLREIAKAIPRPLPPPYHNLTFFALFKEIAMFNHQSVLLEQWPRHISHLIEYLRACIAYARDPASIARHAPNPLFNAHTTRLSTQQATWESYARVWEDAIEKWTQFLNLFNKVYDYVRVNNYVEALITLIQYSPSCIKFWRYFWSRLVFAGGIAPVQRYTRFQHLLNNDILPGIIHPDNPQRALQMNLCRRGLQYTVDELQDVVTYNGNINASAIFNARLFNRESVDEALRLTEIILTPHVNLIGEESRRIAQVQNNHEMVPFNDFVYFRQ
jgi:hypothetical protein